MRILKFGQSTLKDSASINEAINVIEKHKKDNLVIVVSAFDKVLPRLQDISHRAMVGDNSYKPIFQEIEDEHFVIVKKFIDVKRQAKVIAHLKVMLNDLEEILYGVYLLWELSPRTQDHIQTHGVRLGAFLISEILKEKGLDIDFLDTQKVIVTNNQFGNATVDFAATNKKIKNYFDKAHKVTVVTGHIGSTSKGESTTLGKAGSSYTASIFAAAIDAKEIEIYTDRDGVTNADQDMVKGAYSLNEVSYAEAMELSNFGTQVIYPPSLQPAFNKNIPIVIKNLFNSSFKGTKIIPSIDKPKNAIKASSSLSNVSLLTIQGSGMVGVAGVAARVFTSLATNSINVVLITQASSEHSITLAIAPEDGDKARKVINTEFEVEVAQKKVDKVALTEDMAILAIIGDNMKKTPGIAGKVFTVLGQNKINISAIAQGSSELNISLVLENKDLKKALNVIQENFFTN